MKVILMKRFAWICGLMIATVSLPAAEETAKTLTGTVLSIDGKPVELDSYAAKVVPVVNVASHCGFTRQYRQLQKIYTKYENRGFVVLGFPCNQFGRQESGSNTEIKSFCERTFAVSFPMFSKIDVN